MSCHDECQYWQDPARIRQEMTNFVKRTNSSALFSGVNVRSVLFYRDSTTCNI